MVAVRVLGAVEVHDDDGLPVAVGGPRPTSILVSLALAGGSVVSVDGLVTEVWGDHAPRSVVETLQSYLSRLRRVLEPERTAHVPGAALVRSPAGYRLDPSVIEVDAHRFEVELGEARAAMTDSPTDPAAAHGPAAAHAPAAAHDPAAARELAVARYDSALARWRGPVGHGTDLGAAGRAEATRLEELRLTATEERATVLLDRGEHERLVGELEAWVIAHPVRERLHGLWMVALHRSGRQAEALAAYRRLRAQLVEALGVEPGPRVAQLHARILAQDPTLDAPPTDAPTSRGIASTSSDPLARRGPVAPPPRPDLVGRHEEGDAASRARPAPGAAPPGNLPAPLVELVGVAEQRVRLVDQLERSRLVTLTGAGGCGKTQLALQVARDATARHPDGTWLVELASLRAPDASGPAPTVLVANVAGAVAEVLGVDDAPLAELLEALASRLRGRRTLLVLDNCEHLVDAAAELVRELLQRCPELRVLATSRQTLDLDGEVAWRVPSLSLPPVGASTEDLAGSDAARLFLSRAAAVEPAFAVAGEEAAAIAAICRGLDGIPLAIELAASRLRVLSPSEIADRLDDRFAMLRSSRRGAPPRHHTLDAAIGWSYELLTPEARRLFLRLAVFEGGFTVAAAEAVCRSDDLPHDRVLEVLDDLVGRSLVVTVPGAVGPARHALLRSIRSFARARWTEPHDPDRDPDRDPDHDADHDPDHDRGDGIAAVAARQHAEWFARVGDDAVTELTGHDQVRWLNQLHADHADVRAALHWSAEHGRTDLGLRTVAGVWWFWLQFGHVREGLAWLTRVLGDLEAAPPELAPDPVLVARTTYAAGRLAGAAGDATSARRWLALAAARAERVDAPGLVALSHARLGQQLQLDGEPEAAAAALAAAEVAVAGTDDPWVRAGLSDVAGHLAVAAGDLDRAASAFRASEAAYLAAEDRWSACLARIGRAWVARRVGDAAAALALHGENLRATRELTRSAFDFVGLARDLRGVAALAARAGAAELAARLCGASEALRDLGEVALTSDERAEVEQALREATDAIGADGVQRAQASGRSLGAAAALDLALAATEDLAALAATDAAP